MVRLSMAGWHSSHTMHCDSMVRFESGRSDFIHEKIIQLFTLHV